MQSAASEASRLLTHHGPGVGRGGVAPKLMDFSLLKPIRANFGLEIRLQIILQVDCNVCLKIYKNLKKKKKFSEFVRKIRNSYFKRKSGISEL